MAATNSNVALVDQISPALAFDISIKEIEQNGHDDERMVLVFNALDQIIPQLGIFSSVTLKLRNELFDFVYSNQFTVEQVVSKPNKKRKRVACLERLSYKILCQRLVEQHQDEMNVYESKLSDMENGLAGKNRDLNQSREQLEQLDKARHEVYNDLIAMREALNKKEDEIQSLNEERDRIQHKCEQEVHTTRLQVKEVMENQAATEALIDELVKYKQGYDEMQEAFIDNSTRGQHRTHQRNLAEDSDEPYIDVKNQLMLDIQVAIRFEEQMLTLLNITTEDFDQLLESEHGKLVGNNLQVPSESQFIWTNIETEQSRYARSIKEIRQEIDIMQRHRRGLEEKLEMIILKENEEHKDQKAAVTFTTNESAPKTGKSSNPLRGLENAFESAGRKTDLVGHAPQERVLSRFACMLSSSADRRAWNDFELASYCDSCADKTYLCPHKFAEPQVVVRVPNDTKYIRITRPTLKYNESIVRNVIIENQPLLDEMLPQMYQQNTASVMRTNYPGFFAIEETPRTQQVVAPDEHPETSWLIHTFDRVWIDYEQRTDKKHLVPRPFTMERLFTLITEILAYECHCDKQLINVTGNIVDDIYEFFTMRYSTIEQIIYDAVYDFFTSLITYKDQFKILELFSHVLIGNIDIACVFYLAAIADVLETIEWYETEDIRTFFAIIYPFLDDEALDTLLIDFTAYTENKISRFLVVEFLITLLLKGKEPLSQEMQYKLSVQLTQNFDMMNELEFQTAIENIVYTADERIVSRLFRRAERHSHWYNLQGFVPMGRLAHVVAFFFFKQLIDEQKVPLNEKIQKEHDLRMKEDTNHGRRVANQRIDERAELIKYSKLQGLGDVLYEESNAGAQSVDEANVPTSESPVDENDSTLE